MTDAGSSSTDRLTRLFELARGLEPSRRSEFLDRECADDDQLREELESLLANHDRQGDFLADPTADMTATPVTPSPLAAEFEPGAVVGRFRIIRELGDGGFGVVYLAEQTEPVRRQVAMKVIKRGMDSTEVLARFEAERQVLALMNHPNVATVHDAGVTDSGRPYFVMEYVPGDPITEYCDRHRVSMAGRLELFLKTCEGIQHAHQKGIIHRDIKPSNVLVSVREGTVEVKVIDFGVAKATNQPLSEREVFTELGQLIGTPAYMSPEQAEMGSLDIDTRSDIYSLGVLLYELLTGSPPFDPVSLREAGYAEIQRIIREVDPPKPSTKLSSLGSDSADVARNRGCDARALQRGVRGDLDWVVMRCLDKDRTRRYDTANGLAEDIHRHVRNEPVVAGPPSAAYRLRKFMQRNRGPVVAVTTALLILLLGAGSFAWAWRRSVRNEQIAMSEAARAREFSQFVRTMLKGVDPDVAGDLDTTLFRLMLDNASARVTELHDPLIEASVRATIGESYTIVGAYDRAEVHLDRACDLLRQERGDEDPGLLRTRRSRAGLYMLQSRYAEAEQEHESVLAVQRRVLGDEHQETLDTLHNIAVVHIRLGHYDQAEPIADSVVDARTRLYGLDHPETLESANVLALVHIKQGEYEAATSILTPGLEACRRVLGPRHTMAIQFMGNLGLAQWNLGHQAEAEALLRDAARLNEEILGPDHPRSLDSMHTLATVIDSPQVSLEIYLRILDAQRRVLGDTHSSTLITANNVAGLYSELGRHDDAERLYEQTLHLMRSTLADDHPNTLGLMNNLAVLYEEQGRYKEAAELYRQALDVHVRSQGEDHPNSLRFMTNLADLHSRLGHVEKAEPLLKQVIDIKRRKHGDTDPRTLRSKEKLAIHLAGAGQWAGAESLLQEVLSAHRERLGPDHQTTLRTQGNLAALYVQQGHPERAIAMLEETLDAVRADRGDTHADTLDCMNNLALTYLDLGRLDDADRMFRDILAVQRRELGDDHPRLQDTKCNLGRTLNDAHRFEEAIPLLEEALESQRRHHGVDVPEVWLTAMDLAIAYENTDRLEDAEQLHRQTLAAQRRTLTDEHHHTLQSMVNLASVRFRQGVLSESELLLNEAVETSGRIFGDDSPLSLLAVRNLITLYGSLPEADSTALTERRHIDLLALMARHDEDNAHYLNEYAWLLLRARHPSLRDPQMALSIARRADELTGHADPRLLDTLSLALHMNGQSEEAAENQRHAIGLVPPNDTEMRATLQAALAEYEAATDTSGAK